jgi:carboxypeptidase C (cathepsin A)
VKGNALTDGERVRVAEGLARFTGLPQSLLEKNRLRVSREDFQGELLRDQKLFLSLFDSRLAASTRASSLVDDPAVRPTVGPLVSSFLHHLKDELRFDTDRPYRLFSEDVNARWDWSASVEGASPGITALQDAMNRSPKLRVLAAAGIYDLATPYTTAQYTIQHLAIDPARQKNILVKTYECGHMPYMDTAILKQWTADVADFVKTALQEGG